MNPDDPPFHWPENVPSATHRMFTLVAEHTHNAALVVDHDGVVLWGNHAFARITGYNLHEARGRRPFELLQAPDTDPKRLAEIDHALARGEGFDATLHYRRKDRSCGWLRLEAQPIPGPEGEVAAFLLLGTDVTAQVERETDLARKEALFNEAQHIAHIGNWDFDLLTKKHQWSAETFRIHGLPVGEALPVEDGIASFVEEHRPIIETAFTQCCLMGVPYDVELQLRRADGNVRWVRCLGRAFTAEGRVVRVAGTIQDIDDRKRAELEVARLAERMTLAAKFAGIGIWEYNQSTDELIWDDAMLSLHGLHREAFPGNSSIWHLVIFPEDHAAEEQMKRAFDDGRGEFDIEYRILTPDDEIRYIRNCGRIVRDSAGRILRSYGVNYDITRERVNMIALLESDESLRAANASLQATIEETQRLAEAAQAANRAKSAFLATISHEIRTPLNGVIGMTNILAGTALSPEQREFVNTIKLSGQSLLTLINDTLDYSKIEAGRVELERRPFDLRACVEGAIDLVAPHAAQKSLSLSHLVAADVPRAVEGDAARLRQILVNLLGNAVKFTDHGRVSLAVQLESAPADEVVLLFSVTDTGIGIPKDKQPRLFEHFFQVDASITRTHGGTGLGLAISRRLAELMGGTIAVESELGQGSSFVVRIRVPAVIDDALLDHAACRARLTGRHALLVLPPEAVARVERLAREAGLVVALQPNDAAALDHLASGARFDLVVSDKHVAGMDGLAFARQLLERGLKPLPLLHLSRVGELTSASTPRFHQLMASLLPPAESAAAEAPQRARPADTMPLSILMAEDNTVNQRVAQLTLRRLGYEVEIVANGADALDAFASRSFDVVLMDVHMPGMDGLEATRRIRENPAHRTHPWIIALTAGAFEEDRLAAFAAGMNDFLAKPLRIELLEAALAHAHKALQKHRSEAHAG